MTTTGFHPGDIVSYENNQALTGLPYPITATITYTNKDFLVLNNGDVLHKSELTLKN